MTWRWEVAHLFYFFWVSISFRGDRKPSQSSAASTSDQCRWRKQKEADFQGNYSTTWLFAALYTGNLASFILGQRYKEVFLHEGIILAPFHSTGYKDAVSAAWEHSSQCSGIFLDFSVWVPSHCAHLSHIEDCCFLILLLQGILQEALPPSFPSQQKQKGQKLPSHEVTCALISQF